MEKEIRITDTFEDLTAALLESAQRLQQFCNSDNGGVRLDTVQSALGDVLIQGIRIADETGCDIAEIILGRLEEISTEKVGE